MDEKKAIKPYGDVMVVTGKYQKDGKERNRYMKIGTLFATPHKSSMTVKIDLRPQDPNWDGWCKVFVRDDWQEPEDAISKTPNEEIDF